MDIREREGEREGERERERGGGGLRVRVGLLYTVFQTETGNTLTKA